MRNSIAQTALAVPALILLLAAPPLRAQTDMTGLWILRVPTGGVSYFDLKQNGETLTGVLIDYLGMNPKGSPISGTLRDNHLHFVATRDPSRQIVYDGRLEAGGVSLTQQRTGQETEKGRLEAHHTGSGVPSPAAASGVARGR